MAESSDIEVPEINLGQFMIDRMRTFGSAIALVSCLLYSAVYGCLVILVIFSRPVTQASCNRGNRTKLQSRRKGSNMKKQRFPRHFVANPAITMCNLLRLF